jgi:hypothetical protein
MIRKFRLRFPLGPLQRKANLVALSSFAYSGAQDSDSIPKAILAAAGIIFAVNIVSDGVSCQEKCTEVENAPGLRPGMKVYTRAEVAKHSSLYTGVWTTFGNGNMSMLFSLIKEIKYMWCIS